MMALRIVAFVAALACAAQTFAYVRADKLSAEAGFTQLLGANVPRTLAFHDESGRGVRLGEYYGDSPIVLAFAWFGCTTLCPTVVRNLAQTLAQSGVAPDRYRVLVASIDPRDSPADATQMKGRALDVAPHAAATWHFLTGRESDVAALTGAAGFRYAYDADTHQYAHPVGFLLLTRDGRISRYFFGFDFTPAGFRQALDDAANDQVASPIDRLLLLCFHFAPAGRYSALVMQALRIASVVLFALALGLLVAKRRDAAR
jgi:protein SCO1